MKMKYFGLVAPALLLALACGEQKAVVDNSSISHNGLRKVSLTDNRIFQGDITKIPGYSAMISAKEKESAVAPKATPLALIPFKQARVMVLWHDYFSDQTYDPCTEYQEVATIFSGRQLNKWNELVDGCRRVPDREVVYEGALTKSGSNVVGEIYVKPGINVVHIGYIDTGDTLTYLSTAHYVNFEGLGIDLPYGYTDGWEVSSGDIWESREHTKVFNSTYGDYYVVYGVNTYVSQVGFNKSYADLMCQSMMP